MSVLLSKYTYGPKSFTTAEISSEEIVEYGNIDYNSSVSTGAVEFVLVYAYDTIPVITTDIAIDYNTNGDIGDELIGSDLRLVPVFMKDEISVNGVPTMLYSRIIVYCKGNNIFNQIQK